VSAEQVRRDIHRLFRGNFEQWTNRMTHHELSSKD